MPNITLESTGYYKVDPLYQWDINQILYIYGVNVPTPIIHFTNSGMGASINRYGDVDKTGVISVKIPNSLLQKNSPIIAYICGYEGETFKTYYKLEIPVKTRTKPSDYTLDVDDEEVYSFEAYTKLVYDAINEYESKYNNVLTKLSSCESNVVNNNTRVAACEDKVDACITTANNLTEHVKSYDDAIADAKNYDYRVPWNLDANVGVISGEPYTVGLKIGSSESGDSIKTIVRSMPIINSGTIRLSFEYLLTSYSYAKCPEETNYIKIYLNDEVVYERSGVTNMGGYTQTYALPDELELTVNHGDVLTLELSCQYLESSSEACHIYLYDFQILTNIDTPYQYKQAFESLENVSTSEILNTLLGVE